MSARLCLVGETVAELRTMLLAWYVAPLALRVLSTEPEVQAVVLLVDGPPGAARLAWQLARTADPALPLHDPIPSDAVDRAHRRLHGAAVLDPDRLQAALHALAANEPRPWALVRRATNAHRRPGVSVDVLAEPLRPDPPWPSLLSLPVSLTLQEARTTLARAGDWKYTVDRLRAAADLLAGRSPLVLPENVPRLLDNAADELRGLGDERW